MGPPLPVRWCLRDAAFSPHEYDGCFRNGNACCELANRQRTHGDFAMNSIIYLIGLIVVILAVLSFFGLA